MGIDLERVLARLKESGGIAYAELGEDEASAVLGALAVVDLQCIDPAEAPTGGEELSGVK
ncbi:hypothetical protein [Streptomyces sp. SLBN-118]|uniref:hypothetical protein n=1 Tax=Streptomyces sp. SLBN-118 TaxID=2768454 RepID=UPI00114E9021|nr:hypothetical protein [Streptomyces sp. SLBN-118]